MTSLAHAGYKRKFVKGDGAVPTLKKELVKAQTSYGKELLKLVAAKKGDASFPWPLGATRTIERPPQFDMWDVEELSLSLTISLVRPTEGSEDQHSYMVPKAELVNWSGVLPEKLATIIGVAVQQKWESLLRKRDATPRKNFQSWAFERVFDWADTQYGKFLRLVPDVIESYLGTSLRGQSQRRYLVQVVTEFEAVVEDLTEEERLERKRQALANFMASQNRKLQRELDAQREKERQGALRRCVVVDYVFCILHSLEIGVICSFLFGCAARA